MSSTYVFNQHFHSIVSTKIFNHILQPPCQLFTLRAPPSQQTKTGRATNTDQSSSRDQPSYRGRAEGCVCAWLPNSAEISHGHCVRRFYTFACCYSVSYGSKAWPHRLARTTVPPLSRTPHAFPFSTKTSSTCAPSLTSPPFLSTPRTRASTRASVPPLG